MKKNLVLIIISLAFFAPIAFAGDWLDEFNGPNLNPEWFRITGRPGNLGSVDVKDGKLLLFEPEPFDQLVTDGRPLVLMRAPEGDFSISALVDTDPPAPSTAYWVGLIIVGKDGDHSILAKDWAMCAVGGWAGQNNTMVGSMIDGELFDAGHLLIPSWPIHLKLEKVGAKYTGYFRENPTDQWTQLGESWNHDNMGKPELVGFSIIINFDGGPELTLIADYFLLEGQNVIPMAISLREKFACTWGHIKSCQ